MHANRMHSVHRCSFGCRLDPIRCGRQSGSAWRRKRHPGAQVERLHQRRPGRPGRPDKRPLGTRNAHTRLERRGEQVTADGPHRRRRMGQLHHRGGIRGGGIPTSQPGQGLLDREQRPARHHDDDRSHVRGRRRGQGISESVQLFGLPLPHIDVRTGFRDPAGLKPSYRLATRRV